MPNGFTVAKAADWLAILDHIGYHIYLGQAFDEAAPDLLDGRQVEVAKTAAEADQLGIGQFLVPNQQHQIVQPGAMQLGKLQRHRVCAGRCRCISAPSPAPVGFTLSDDVALPITLPALAR